MPLKSVARVERTAQAGKHVNQLHPDFSDRRIVHDGAQEDGRMIVRISDLFVLTASPSRPIRSRYCIALSNTPGSLIRPPHPSEGPRRASSHRADHAPVADRYTRILGPNLERSSLSCISLLAACDKERLHAPETRAARGTFSQGETFVPQASIARKMIKALAMFYLRLTCT